jgi:hypothetical protein
MAALRGDISFSYLKQFFLVKLKKTVALSKLPQLTRCGGRACCRYDIAMFFT